MGTTLFGPAGPAGFSDLLDGSGNPPSKEDLIVQPLSASQWRVSDRRYSEHDASSLLGFIEKKDDRFELTQLEHGFQWFYFSSLPEAIDHFTQTLPEDSLAEPELTWSPNKA